MVIFLKIGWDATELQLWILDMLGVGGRAVPQIPQAIVSTFEEAATSID